MQIIKHLQIRGFPCRKIMHYSVLELCLLVLHVHKIRCIGNFNMTLTYNSLTALLGRDLRRNDFVRVLVSSDGLFNKYKTFSVLIYSYINTSGKKCLYLFYNIAPCPRNWAKYRLSKLP
jgi:hypothetical protein